MLATCTFGFFFFSKSYSQPLKWAGLCMALNHPSLNLLRQNLQLFLIFWAHFLPQDVWLRGAAGGQHHGERVSPVCRDGPRAARCGHRQLHQQSHAGASAAQMRPHLRSMELLCVQYHLFKAVLDVFDHRAWLFP